MVALDLSAAFDTVNLKILLEVLNKYYGFQGAAIQWIKSYLANRQFRVQIEGKFSETKTINFQFHKEAFYALYFSHAMLVYYKNSSQVTTAYLDMLMITPLSSHSHLLITKFLQIWSLILNT